MRTLALLILVTGCAAAAPAPQPASQATDGSAQALARTLFSSFHERIVEAKEHRSGPGAVLTHISLYERPQTARLQGLCEVTVHDVGVPFAPPPADPPLSATWVRTGTRYFAIGEVGPSVPPPDQERSCAALPTAQNFFSAPSRETAHGALQTYSMIRRWAANPTNEATLDCTALSGPCPAPRALFGEMLTPDRIVAVSEAACEAGRPGRGTRYFTYHLSGPMGPWEVSIKGPERPLHVRVRQSVPPVS